MRLAISPAIASVLFTLVTSAPSLAWGADGTVGIDVLKAGIEDVGAFDAAIAKSRSKDLQSAKAAAKAAVGIKVQTEALKLRDAREHDIQDSKNFGSWVKSTNKGPGGKGSAATVGDDDGNGSGGGNSSQSTRGNSSKSNISNGHGTGH
jgi:hypothetical protein